MVTVKPSVAKDLLHFSAKAAGVNTWGMRYMRAGRLYSNNFEWAPLTDSGSALNLAVQLGFSVNVVLTTKRTGVISPMGWFYEDHQNSDPVTATRLAIVRAAAAAA